MKVTSCLLMLVGCGEVSNLESIGMQAPPPSPLRIEVTPITAGSPFTVTVSGANPGSLVYVATGSTLGPGPCPAILSGLCLGLVAPTLRATLTANGSGVATLTATLASTFAASGLGFQAATANFANSKTTPAIFVDIASPSSPAPCRTWTITSGAAGATSAFVPLNPSPVGAPFSERKLSMRPINLSGTGSVQIDAIKADLYTPAGSLISSGTTLTDATIQLYVDGVSAGQDTIVATPVGGSCGPAKLDIEVGRVELGGRSLAGAPYFEHVRGFWHDEDIEIALDTKRHADRIGVTFDAYLEPHRTWAARAASPTLTSAIPIVTGTPVAGFTDDNIWTLGMPVVTSPVDYDIVFDFDRNGQINAGDLVQGTNDRPAVTPVGNMTTAGPAGYQQVDVAGSSTYRDERIYAPLTIPATPMPLIVISHGNGHDYRWYDYLGRHLASYGYVIMSHRSNTGPGPASASTTLLDNVGVFLTNYTSYFGGALTGKLNGEMSWIGHSRGGEAVALAYDDLVEGTFTSPLFDDPDIVTVSSIAPTVFLGVTQADPHFGTYHLIAGGADGDVTGGVDCPVCQYLRIPAYGDGRTLVTYVQGASHNNFHSGGGWDDATGPSLIGASRTQAISKETFLGLFQWHHRGQTVFEELFTRGHDGWRPSWLNPADVVSRQFIPGPDDGARVIDDFQTNTATNLSSSGGAVSFSVLNVQENKMDDTNTSFTHSTTDGMNGMTQVEGDGDERGLAFDWNGHAWIEWAVPAAMKDVRGFDTLMLRAAQGTRHTETEALDDQLSFGLTLRDGSGRMATIRPGFWQEVQDPYERTGVGTGAGWANEFATVRAHLTDFLADGTQLDLSDIVAVRIEVGAFYGSPNGRIGIDDLEFAIEGQPTPTP